ncbi:phosphate acetyltransferase [Okeania sp.]|uniref:phosphate acetyltransferase n=1 Tax=Okeania sp. TaxID=3100323 RepID=UPI002B4AD182|nr:phosphate acetyltransferase [Okeania sp.]MEB3343357.1 phosphate acetyltransferase [Okeania sp.]
MTISLYIATLEAYSGKALLSLGIIEQALLKTTKVGFFRPLIRDTLTGNKDKDIDLIITQFNLQQNSEDSYGLSESEAIKLINQHQHEQILEKIITKYKALEANCDFILCECSDYLGRSLAWELDINREIVKNLGCPIILLTNGYQKSIEEITSTIKITLDAYQEKNFPIMGIVVNKVVSEQVNELKEILISKYQKLNYLVSVIPYTSKLNNPRVREIATQLKASLINGKEKLDNLVSDYLVTAMEVSNALNWLQEDQLIITSGDRGDIILAMLQAERSKNYPSLAGILLSGGISPAPSILKLIDGLPHSLPILSVETDTYTTATQAKEVIGSIVGGDMEKISLSLELFSKYVDGTKLENRLREIKYHGMTPKMFIYNLHQQAKIIKKHIVLPEGEEPRILQAASFLLSQEMVNLTLLGNPKNIESSIIKNGINLDANTLKIIEPNQHPKFQEYAETFYELRKHKGITLDAAKDYMRDVSYFGTMMVQCGDADGMVSGAVHTTQHTIRPALQIIKTKPGFSLVSSVFFMCLPNHVLVYGDCAVNPHPNPEELAEIALASAETASMFGIEPKVALLSYSSGASGKGEEVEKVRQATAIAKQRQPDLLLEGPIQYDAAVDASVAAQKMPDSQVAGQATVFVFPDLNTGNNTYKAVQRETGAIAIGPILQGLKKPVNDLSRGCKVEDIINTVAITAIQGLCCPKSEKTRKTR